MTITTEDAIKAAAAIARDVADGRLTPAAIEQQGVTECRALFGNVVGPGDPFWELHRSIAREVLALDGIPADELAEWLAVARQRAGETVGEADRAETRPEPDSRGLDDPGLDYEGAETINAKDEMEPQLAQPPTLTVVTSPEPRRASEQRSYDPLTGWSPGNSRRS